MKNLILLFFSAIFLGACQEEDVQQVFSLTEKQLNLPTHKLNTYLSLNDTKYLVVFESGLGSGHSVWASNKLLSQVLPLNDVLMYDRAGYEKSTIDTNSVRNIENMRKDLEIVIDSCITNPEQKVILVGHSLGGFVIRDYAIRNPHKVAALLFVDSSHEDFITLPQQAENGMVADFTQKFGKNAGVTKEASQLIENIAYMKKLPNLPNIPICAISGLRTEVRFSAKDKQRLFDTHQKLRVGVNDFTHIASTTSGHYVMEDDPNLIVHGIQLLLSKLPQE
jgi:pimeloyl-ACP methyl ester carboxylesterase